MRPDFLSRPAAWTRARRTSQSQADEACAVYAYEQSHQVADVLLLLLLVVLVGLLVWGVL